MIEKLEEYGRFLFGWAFRAMQSEMTMPGIPECKVRESLSYRNRNRTVRG